MSKRDSLQARFLTWVETAPVTEVELVLGICTGRLKARQKGSQVVQAATVTRKRAKRRTKAEMAAAATQEAHVV